MSRSSRRGVVGFHPPSATNPSPPTTATSLLDKVRLWWRGTVLPVSTTHHLAVALLLGRRVAAGHARRRLLLYHRVALAVRVLVLKVLRCRRGIAVAGSRAVVEACRPEDLLVLLGEQGLLVLELLLADGRDAGRGHCRAVGVLGRHEAVRGVRVERGGVHADGALESVASHGGVHLLSLIHI